MAGFLSILITRIERIADRNRALRGGDGDLLDASVRDAVAKAYRRRMRHLSRAIYFAVFSALVTAMLLIFAFLAALVGLSHGGIVAVMFVVALALLIASLVELTREIRLHMTTLRVD